MTTLLISGGVLLAAAGLYDLIRHDLDHTHYLAAFLKGWREG